MLTKPTAEKLAKASALLEPYSDLEIMFITELNREQTTFALAAGFSFSMLDLLKRRNNSLQEILTTYFSKEVPIKLMYHTFKPYLNQQ